MTAVLPPPPPSPSLPAPPLPPVPASAPPGRLARIGWRAAAVLALAINVPFWTVKAVDVVAHEERTEVATVAADGIDELVISTVRGEVEVVGTDRDDIKLTARVSDGLRPTRYASKVVDGQLRVTVRCTAVAVNTWCSTTLRIEVPRRLAVTIRAVDDGATVTGIAGAVDLLSEDGSVEVRETSGPVRLHSENGAARGLGLRSTMVDASTANGAVDLMFVVPPTEVRARSENGNVEVAIPPGDEVYKVTVDSDSGSTSAEVRTDPAATQTIDASTPNGDVTVRYLR